MNCILCGHGEIGKAIESYYGQYHRIDVYDIKEVFDPVRFLGKYDILLVTIPYSEHFTETVKEFQTKFNVKDTVIFSTVAIGTTSQIPNAVHSPIEGKHPLLSSSIRLWQVFIGGHNIKAEDFFNQAYKQYFVLNKPEQTEFLKLQSTTNYGLMLEYARYCKSVCDKIGMSYEYVKKFNQCYNDLYVNLFMPEYQRYILNAPDGILGGHCVLPNAKILNGQFENLLVSQIIKNNA
jgi:hypothetical protein